MDKYRIKSKKALESDLWTPGYLKPAQLGDGETGILGILHISEWLSINNNRVETEEEADIMARDYLINVLNVNPDEIE